MDQKIVNIGTDEAHIRSLQKQIHDTIKASGILNVSNEICMEGAQMAVYALHQVAMDLKGNDEHGKAFIEESLAEVLTFYKPDIGLDCAVNHVCSGFILQPWAKMGF